MFVTIVFIVFHILIITLRIAYFSGNTRGKGCLDQTLISVTSIDQIRKLPITREQSYLGFMLVSKNQLRWFPNLWHDWGRYKDSTISGYSDMGDVLLFSDTSISYLFVHLDVSSCLDRYMGYFSSPKFTAD